MIASCASLGAALAVVLLLGATSSCGGISVNNSAWQSLSTPVKEYCNLPQFQVDDAQGDSPLPGYELLKVFVVVRHGSRFVMHHTRFGPLPMPRLSCRFSEEQLNASVVQPVLGAFLRQSAAGLRRIDAGTWRYPPVPDAPLCGYAHLTPLGVEQLLRLGSQLRISYSGRLNISRVHARSTDTRRTYQSAVALLYGLNPAAASSLSIERVGAHDESFCSADVVAVSENGASCACQSIAHLKKRARAELKSLAQPMDAAHARFVAEAVRAFGRKKAKAEYPWKRAHDYLMQGECSRLRPLPCYRTRCFAQRHVEDLWAHLSFYFSAMSRHPTFARKSRIEMQPFLWEVAQRVDDADYDVFLYSGHDGTIASLALALGIPLTAWPAYASSIVFELYSRSDDGSRHLRVLYDGRDVTRHVRFFPPPSRTLCPLEAFANFAHVDNMQDLGHGSWRSACDSASA